ncbi:hypothetical protein [Phormidesmis priestleyi]
MGRLLRTGESDLGRSPANHPASGEFTEIQLDPSRELIAQLSQEV